MRTVCMPTVRLSRRGVLAGSALLALLPSPLWAQARGRPPDRHFRMEPVLIPVREKGPFAYVRVQADLVLTAPEQRDAVRALAPRLYSRLLDATWDVGITAEGRVTAESAKHLKSEILSIAQGLVGPVVEDVLIVSLIVG